MAGWEQVVALKDAVGDFARGVRIREMGYAVYSGDDVANLAWLAPRLDCVQRWILLDHDTQVLSAVDHPEEIDGVAEIARRSPRVVAQLLAQGADAEDATHVLTAVADAIGMPL